MRNNKALRVIIPAVTVLTAAVTTAVFFMKRHARKGRYAAFALIAAVILCGASMTAYAYTDEDAEREINLGEILTPVVTPVSVPTQEPTPDPTPAPEPQPLTPPGNLTLVDDLSGVQTNDKQFITVITKSGNYFYIIIDRAGDRENVHFLNLVDEADLMAILEKDKKTVSTTPTPVESKPEPTPTPEPTPEPKQNNIGGILIILLLVGALGGGAYYYFKVLKPKQAIKSASGTELDDFDFDGDEDDFIDEGTGGEQALARYEADEDMPDFTLTEEPTDTEPDGGRLPESEDE